MKNKFLIISVILLLWSCLTEIQAQNTKEFPKGKDVQITYVGNAGFLINIGDKKILIDALFKGFKGNYNLPQKIQDKLTLAQAPFDNVDLILVTHAHGDHVNPDMVRQHLQNNPKAIFASTQQMVNALNGFTDRCIAFNPTKEKSDSKVINDISIETFYLPHGPNSKIINIGFLVSVNGITFFQTGDADFEQFTFDQFRSLQLPEKKIDLLFIQHYYLRGDALNTKFVNEAIAGTYIIPIHYHFTTPSFDRSIILNNYPDAIIFKEELQSWRMPDKKDKFPVLKGDYLGQPLPGETPQIFARGIVSTKHLEHSAPRFSPDGTEVFWERVSLPIVKGVPGKMILNMQRSGNFWSRPTVTKDFPVFSADGKRFYFSSLPKPTKKTINTARQSNSKNQANYIYLLAQYPELKYTRGLSIADNRSIYFMSHLEGPLNGYGIYRSELIDGEYAKPEPLPLSINKPGFLNWTPFIAPDESYLLFSSNRRDSKNDAGDLYISFRLTDGTWTNPVNLGKPVNSPGQERFPMLSLDGKYLFFTRPTAENHQDVFWVSTKIIDEIKTQVFADISLKEEMFKAVNAGELAKVKALIKSDRNLLEIKDKGGSTPLIRACLIFNNSMSRPVEVAKFLIEAGANVNVINNRKQSALIRASVGYGGPDYELIKLLISKGADVNIQGRNGITALHWAVKYNDIKIAKFLLENGADINISDDYNGPIRTSTISGTVLQVAINYSKSNEMVKFVIENRAKLNIKDSQGNTELHLVALKGNTEQTKILIEHGIDLNAKNNLNRTALYYAAKHGNYGAAELLIASGADKNTIVETNYGKAKQLSESLDEGEAYIWDLNYRYAVKTKNNLLVFTFGGGIGESSESGLANGFLNADELKDQKITIFFRNRGQWRMDGKKFTEYTKLTTNVNMVSNYKPDFSKMKESEIPAYHLALPNESFSVNGLKVHPIKALAHGMGYLVEVDGLKIFHAGLHISDDKPEHIEKFRKEIDFLKPFGPIDIVMLSTHSHSRNVGTEYEQYLYLLDKLAPKVIYLWGANVLGDYKMCAEFLKVRNIPIVYPEIIQAAGERFHYLRDGAKK